MSQNKETKKPVNWGVFIPCFVILFGSAVIGMINNKWLTAIASGIFTWSLDNFSWLFQITSIFTLLLVGILLFSKFGKIRFGGPEAKAKFTFGSWFAMTLTGGIATGLITYGVNEVLVYYGDIWGELDGMGIKPFTDEAAFFSMGRVFYHWTFVPYAMYALSGLIAAYMYFNRNQELSVSASLTPLFGERVTKGFWRGLVDTLSVLAIGLGLAASLGAGLALIGSGLHSAYGMEQGPILWFALSAVITVTFTVASVSGLDKGIKWLAGLTSKIFYILLFVLFIIGPTLYIMNLANVGLGYWLDHFWTWGFDPYLAGGKALVEWWTMYAWAMWIAYAPLMGIFFAMIAYGRTIRQFLVINWILPSVFGGIWFAVWGGTALNWQMTGKSDLVAAIQANGAMAGLWEFLKSIPLGVIIIPVVMITLIAAFATTADTMSTTIAAVCTKNARHDEEPALWQKILWGVTIGVIAAVMVAFGGGEQGIDGVKNLSACGAVAVLGVFILQIASTVKVFFFDKKTLRDITDENNLIQTDEIKKAGRM